MTSRCFMVEPMHKHPRTEAQLKEFGCVQYLFSPNEWRPSVFDSKFYDELAERLDAAMFNVELDYIVVAGSIAAVSQLAMIALSEFTNMNQVLRTLMFYQEQSKFVEVKVGA